MGSAGTVEEREKGERRRRRRREIRSEEAIDERFWFWLQSLLCVKTELEMLVYLVNFFFGGKDCTRGRVGLVFVVWRGS